MQAARGVLKDIQPLFLKPLRRLSTAICGRQNMSHYTGKPQHNFNKLTEPERFIDLRSDTFTTPTDAMRKAMFEARVGDDAVNEDPTINALQERLALLLQKEAALFVPSGTMGNLLAILCHCKTRGDTVLVGDQSHIMLYEGDGASVMGVPVHTFSNNLDGTFNLDEMEDKASSLVCIENTFNGCALPLEFIDEVGDRLSKKKVPLHVDGARLFNAAVYHNVPASRLVESCSSVSVCFSKGLGAPVGSMLVGSHEFIQRAHRFRHILGGALHQVGVLGAPAQIALERGVNRLADDHQRMANIASAIAAMNSCSATLDMNLVHTNMAMVHINPKYGTAKQFADRIARVTEEEKASLEMSVGIKCYVMGLHTIRLVTYNAITNTDAEEVIRYNGSLTTFTIACLYTFEIPQVDTIKSTRAPLEFCKNNV